ncbi:hypothetical protein VPH35_110397 [Triticum aestivum]
MSKIRDKAHQPNPQAPNSICPKRSHKVHTSPKSYVQNEAHQPQEPPTPYVQNEAHQPQEPPTPYVQNEATPAQVPSIVLVIQIIIKANGASLFTSTFTFTLISLLIIFTC